MDIFTFERFLLIWVTAVVSELQCIQPAGPGHYRCSWYTGPAPSDNEKSITTPTVRRDQSECSQEDSKRLTSYINHCTKQNYVPLLACRDDGTWNCQSFISMCKTLIHADTMPVMVQHHSVQSEPAEQQGEDVKDVTSKDSATNTGADARVFNPDENYFTMKEMAVAVLVSFITGATMLAVVICVVWKCRHSHMSSDQMREVANQSAKRLAAIHAVSRIAQAISIGNGTAQSVNTITNPQYGQLIVSKELLEEALTDTELGSVYEEIFARRKSSCANADCVYANVNKVRKKSSVIRQNSWPNDLKKIEESAEESDIGYEADINATPQRERKHTCILGNNANNAFANSPAMKRNWLHHENNGPFIREPLSFRNYLNNSCNPVEIETGVEMTKNEVGKCDSGYHEETNDYGVDNVTRESDNRNNQVPIGVGERKQSLRL